MMRWLVAFALTLLVEIPVAVTFIRYRWPSTLRSEALSVVVAANLATHPIGIGIVLPLLARSWGPTTATACVESLVVALEAGVYYYRCRDLVWSALISGVTNMASFMLGVLLLG